MVVAVGYVGGVDSVVGVGDIVVYCLCYVMLVLVMLVLVLLRV